jgi:hypothetical protein
MVRYKKAKLILRHLPVTSASKKSSFFHLKALMNSRGRTPDQGFPHGAHGRRYSSIAACLCS